MKHKPAYKPSIRTREMIPLAKKTKNGIVLMCPFCTPTHVITPGIPSQCGSELRVTVVQQIVSARTVRAEGLVCVKCREGGGEMVRYMNGYIHVEECAPDVRLLRETPRYSRFAKMVYSLPEKTRALVERYTGTVQMVHELTPDGAENGVVQGYFFASKVKVNNGYSRQTPRPTP